VPAGTGNDCARNLGVPDDPVAAAHLALTGKPRSVDAGEAQTSSAVRHFLNVAGFGFDADVAERVNTLPKFLSGTAPYVLGVLQTLWQFRAPRIRLTVDEQEIEQTVFLVAVANCPTYGGGMQIAPDATWDDGLFDVCVVGEVSRLEVLRLVPKMYSGGHRGHSAVQFFRCRTLRARPMSTVAVGCQADGELIGSLPATFTIHRGALQCVTGLQY
jgi:diacylglycerol kinase (ATP)